MLGLKKPSRWAVLAWVLALPTLSVLAVIVVGGFGESTPELEHLSQYVLPRVLPNTVWLVLGVTLVATLVGTFSAAVVVFYRFPGRAFFKWALLLPMALPGYVLAFIYSGLLDYAGPLQSMLRTHWNIDVSGTVGTPLPTLIFVLGMALAPYVYLLARGGFDTVGQRALEVAYSNGMPMRRALTQAVLPLSTPWIAAGALLVAMETLADFGAVSVFNYDTLTTAIYTSWFSLFSLPSALRLAAVLLLLVVAITALERYFAYRRKRGAQPGAHVRAIEPRPAVAWLITGVLSVLFILSFALPAAQLVWWSLGEGSVEWNASLWPLLRSSVLLGASAAVLVGLLAVLLSFAKRRDQSGWSQFGLRIAGLGYALPGTLLALGVYVTVIGVRNGLANYVPGIGVGGLALSSALGIMLLAYMIRFAAVALGPVENGMMRLSDSLDQAAQLLGRDGLSMLRTVHWPLLRPAVLTAMLLVLVDVLKEMPITLMTRPFGWDTLAVRVFERTAEAQWAQAAPAALMIVIAGLVPVIILTRKIDHAAATD